MRVSWQGCMADVGEHMANGVVRGSEELEVTDYQSEAGSGGQSWLSHRLEAGPEALPLVYAFGSLL